MRGRSTAIRYQDKDFRSIKKFAEHMHCTPSAVRDAISRGAFKIHQKPFTVMKDHPFKSNKEGEKWWIECLETGERFPTRKEAAEAVKISPQALGQCLKGRTVTSAGYHWRFVAPGLATEEEAV